MLALLAANFSRMQGQSTTGTIQGIVVDSTGLPVPTARVSATSSASRQLRVATTGPDGQFTLPAIAIGAYTLRVEQQGFAAASVKEFSVPVGQTVTHRIVMTPAEVVERIEVTAEPDALQTAANSASVTLGNERIEETPASGRNYLNFVLTAPGVAPSSGSNTRRSAASARSSSPDSGFSFAGMRPRNNSLSIDGVDNRDETTGGNRVAVGLEMVAEFRVSGTNVSPESGSAAGGSVNVVTRSGTNLWHGDFTYFGQHEAPNARNPEAQVDRKPRFRRKQPGVSINGPVKRDRTFFSTAIEQEWEEGEEWSEAPQAFLDALKQRPRAAESRRGEFEAVSRGLFPAWSRQTEFSFKGNHQLTPAHGFSLRYAFSRGSVRNDVQDADNFTDRSARGSSLTRDHSLVAGWTAVLGTTGVSDLRAQWAERSSQLTPNVRAPMIEIPGVLTFGQAWRLDANRLERHAEAVEGVSLVRGRHQWNFGGSIHRIDLDSRLANRFRGIYVFPTIENYLRGTPDVYIQAFGDPHTRLATEPLGLWISDRWQTRPGLTIEAGLRYDRQSLPSPLPESNRNIAPRLGLAWHRGGNSKMVFRFGAGLFYDRSPLAFLNDAVQKDGVHGYEIYRTGVRAIQVWNSTTPTGPRSVYRPDRSMTSTYSRKVTAGVERSLNSETTLTAEYSWVAGYHLPRIRNAALALPAIYHLEQSARSDYQGVSISLNRRMSKEVAYLVSYNTGRAFDDASDFDEHPLNPANLRQDWAHSRQHQAHRISASGLFEFEWLKLDRVTWAPIVSYGTGRPVNALASTDLFRTGAWPISARPAGLARNPFYTRGQFSLDLRVMKTFPLHNDRSRLQVGVESFNLTNHTNPLRFSPYYTAPGYRGIVETLNARQVQFFAQFEY